jgi:hypothetical protein
MALAKRVKVGGSYYKGHTLPIASATGDYALAIVPSSTSYAVNGVMVTPSLNGVGDTFALYHVDTVATVGGNIIATLAESVPNIGGGVSVMLDFATLELVEPAQSLRFIYTNAATTAMSVYVTIETIR